MPSNIKPMLATLIEKPFDDPDWLYEIKWDGYRAVAEIKDGKINLHSRNNLSFNQKFYPIVDSLKLFNKDVILDGEIVVLNDEGKADFQLLQNYQKTGKGNIIYYLFDILYYDGYDLRNLELINRKNILKKVLPEIGNIIYSDHILVEGTSFYQLAEEKNIEGIIAKNLHSIYQTGKRTKDWLKIKIKKRQEAVIAGFTKPKGSRKNFGALVLGLYKGDELVYIGHTGGGFDEDDLIEIKEKLEPLIIKKSPFKQIPKTNTPVTWVQPKLVCEVEFSEWTHEDLMRHPVYLGLREDKDPKGIKLEKPEELPEEMIEKELSSENEKNENEIIIDNKKLKLSNLNKIFFPDEGFTKGDLINYYKDISDFILPYLKERPESLNRHPNGINHKSFYQKDMADLPPEWVKTQLIYSESNDKNINYLICNDKATLIYMINLGCIEINPWFSRVGSLDNPDYFVIDLDPVEISFEKVVETAIEIRKVLETAEIKSYCKTSGATGLHIYIPLGAKYQYDIAKDFAHVICQIVHARIPAITSLERNPLKRKKKVYLDYLQNRKGQTLAAPYSVRPYPGATVSTPLRWEEVKPGLSPNDFTIKNIHKRINKLGDLFKDVLNEGIDIEKSLQVIEKKKFFE